MVNMQPIKMVMTGGWFLFFVFIHINIKWGLGGFPYGYPEDSCISHWEMSKKND